MTTAKLINAHRTTASVEDVTAWPERLNADEFFLRGRLSEGHGDRVAIRLDHRDVTYEEVDRAVSSIASRLLDLGVQREDRVLLVLPDGLDYAATLFAILRIGAVVVMLNPAMAGDAMRAIVVSASPSAAVVDHTYLQTVSPSLGDSIPVLEMGVETLPAADDVETTATRPSDPAMWLFSGGTTGVPKAVPQPHRSLVNTARLYGQGALGLGEEDVTIAVPKLFFGYATGSNLLFPFSVGASAVLFSEHPTPSAVGSRIEQHGATVLVTVPSAVNQMLGDEGFRRADLSSLRVATSAGEALPDTLYERWVDTFGVELLDGLGTAEMWHIFVSNTDGDVRPGTLGRVVPGFEIKACDEDGIEVDPGNVGRLWVRGESLGLGYWANPELTEEAFRGDWFVGGDLVSIDEEGYVTHRGRADDAIKVKGKWFRPQEVESRLLDHPSVGSCAVVAVDDEAGLAKPVAFVVASEGTTEQELIDWVLAGLEPYKHPRRVFFVDTLPQTHLGKVDRAALKRAAG